MPRKDPNAPVPVRLPAWQVDEADRRRGDVSRARWLSRRVAWALELEPDLEPVLSDTKDPPCDEQAGPRSVPSEAPNPRPDGVRPAAPAQDHAATMAERQRRLERARKR